MLDPAGVLSNYDITYNTADFTITPKPASVTPDASGKIYGDADPAFTGTLSGFLVGDGVTATYDRTSGESVAGSPYTISAMLDPAGVLSNYDITYDTASFAISTRPASVTPDASGKTYGAADPSFTGTLSGFVSSDGVTATYSRTSGETVLGSPYTISATLDPAGVLANYDLTYNTASFDISRATPAIAVTGGTFHYDGAAHPATATATGVFSETVAGSFTFTYNGSASEPVAEGTYDVTADFTSSDANYDNGSGSCTGCLVITTNDAPVIEGGAPSKSVSMSVNGKPTPFSLTLNATDPNGDTLTWSISKPASHGTASASGTGSSQAIGYIPTHNYSGSDSFEVQVSDGVNSDTILVNVSVNQLTLTVASLGSRDGWILETSENSGKGGSRNVSSNTLRVGDDAGNRQYRSILSFATGPIPDNAVITSVTLKFRQAGQSSPVNPFSSLGNLLVDVRTGAFGGNTALQAADFQASPSRAAVMRFSTKVAARGWYSKALSSAYRKYINKKGATQFRLRFAKDDNNNLLANYLTLYSGNAAAGYRPVLIIQYYIP
jgi:hypothetical protein